MLELIFLPQLEPPLPSSLTFHSRTCLESPPFTIGTSFSTTRSYAAVLLRPDKKLRKKILILKARLNGVKAHECRSFGYYSKDVAEAAFKRLSHNKEGLVHSHCITKPQDTPPKSPLKHLQTRMEESDLEVSLEEMFKAQIALKDKEETMELPANENQELGGKMLALLAKPYGFRTPPTKVVASHLQQAWKFTNGVMIMPNKYVKGTLVCFFNDQADMKKVEDAGAWSVRGSHILIGRWAIDISMEDVVLDSVNFWVQIRGIPPALLSEKSIRRAAENIGEVLQVEWKDS